MEAASWAHVPWHQWDDLEVSTKEQIVAGYRTTKKLDSVLAAKRKKPQ